MGLRKLLLASTAFLSLSASAQWTEVCSTGNGFVVNLEVFGNELYATGFFNSLCGNPNVHVSKWTLAGWQTAGNGMPEAGHLLRTIADKLYFVGYEPDVDSNWLYVLNAGGGLFNKVGAGVYLTTANNGLNTPNLYNVIGYDGGLVICGEFDRVGDQAISGIAAWDGSGWQPLGSGLSGNIPASAPLMYPHDMCTFGSDLVVAGNFLSAGGQTANGIARWDGSQWHAFGQGFNGPVYCTVEYNGELYAGGEFTQSGPTPLPHHIARWNGSEWTDPGFGGYYTGGMSSYIHTLKVLNNKLYFSGGFNRVVSGNETFVGTAIAAFDGNAVDSLLGGIPGKEIEAIAYYNGHLYAGGGLNGSSYIARYDDVAAVPEVKNDWKIATDLIAHSATITSAEIVEEWTITDLRGQIVFRSGLPSETVVFSVKEAGVYIVTGFSGNATTSRKIVL